jgi:hypothetical protein
MKKSRMNKDQKSFYRITLALMKQGVEIPEEIRAKWILLHLNYTY